MFNRDLTFKTAERKLECKEIWEAIKLALADRPPQSVDAVVYVSLMSRAAKRTVWKKLTLTGTKGHAG